MAIDYEKLMKFRIPDSTQTYTEKDVILYALGLGFGLDPLDESQLDFVYEKHLKVLPSFGVVLAHPGFWMQDPETGIDWMKVVHGEQRLELHRPLQPRGSVVAENRIVDIVDKGAGRGALIYIERRVFDSTNGDLLCVSTQTAFCRGDGGFGGPPRPQPRPHTIPERAADRLCDLPTHPQLALIYRLSGDYNPLHAEPAIGRAAGYIQPILHGLATFGISGHAILRTVAGYAPESVESMSARFTAPAYPGETFRTEIWQDGNVVSFQTRAVERDVIAIGNGKVVLKG